jgi:pimeloyl-ACP methyl ester carboxylesterase
MSEATTAQEVGWRTEIVPVCGGAIPVARAGSGTTVLVLPRDNGHPPRSAFLDRVTATHSVVYPWYPGFHGANPDAWEWVANVRDLAVIQRQLIEALGLANVTVVGLGFGGWVAAEVISMRGLGIDRAILVGPMGIKPEAGYIYDQFIVSTEAYARAGFADQRVFEAIYGPETTFDQLESWETDREMTSRIAWKPYMYNPTLPRLLEGVDTPTLIIAGTDDQIVPPVCAEQYHRALRGSRLEGIPGAGHCVELEHPETVSAAVAAFSRAGVA